MADSRLLLFPLHPLYPRRPDPHFERAFATANSLGLSVGLVDHNAVEKGESAEVVKGSWVDREIVYRGCMIDPLRYDELELALCFGLASSLLPWASVSLACAAASVAMALKSRRGPRF